MNPTATGSALGRASTADTCMSGGANVSEEQNSSPRRTPPPPLQPYSLLGVQLQLLPPTAEGPKQASATGHCRCHSDLILLGCTSILASLLLGMELAELSGDGPRLPPPPGSPSRVTLLSLSDSNSTKLLLPSDTEDGPLDEQASPPESPTCLPQWSPLVDMAVEGFEKDPTSHSPHPPTHVTATQALSQMHRQTPSEGAPQAGSWPSRWASTAVEVQAKRTQG
ncbi:mitogen-activated protein kinase kinase kinase 10-like [Ahaetulla prasina]|uniref:mitogen-activated protein kinase kinase kinase 10-like n=1 Tax=Ahaetulla prasina TaxID=499056 RepID=UPI0026472374|nr:mitogen-activated protein kinase kinase kinase 10-like [Ahaetulla prasina]